uniref:Integrator complex subunit 14 C-terminal domain-containing protein n=1 Tax=Romanomermis culicivorax TaxID=13658 RepID=A0A915IWN3_ROMCU
MFGSGVSPIAWLDSFDRIKYQTYIPPGCPPSLAPQVKSTTENEYKPSYSCGSPSWILNYGLHSDLQKLIRCLKRLPEKDTLFYAELNRVISHALAIGFVELLQLIKEALVKEKSTGLTDVQISHIDYIVGKLEDGNLCRGQPILPFVK